MEGKNQQQPILSPIQMVDIERGKSTLRAIPNELLFEIAEASNAHSVIVIMSSEVNPKVTSQFEIATYRVNDHGVVIRILDGVIKALLKIQQAIGQDNQQKDV